VPRGTLAGGGQALPPAPSRDAIRVGGRLGGGERTLG